MADWTTGSSSRSSWYLWCCLGVAAYEIAVAIEYLEIGISSADEIVDITTPVVVEC